MKYLFLDESGRPEIFNSRGEDLLVLGRTSKYLTIGLLITDDPLHLHKQVVATKNEALNNPNFSHLFTPDYCLEVFHAHADKAEIRLFFLERMTQFNFKSQLIVAEKAKAKGSFRTDPEKFYNSMCGLLLRTNLHKEGTYEIVISRKDNKLSVGKNFVEMVNLYRNEYLAKYGISVQTKIFTKTKPHYSHSALQVVDYVTWAVHRAFELEDKSYLKLINPKISVVWDIFNQGYYTKKNPLS